MELEELIKRIEWLDSERRSDKTTIKTLENRIASLEENTPKVMDELRDLNTGITRLSTSQARFDQIESTQAQMRVDFTRMLEEREKQRTEWEREIEKSRRTDNESNVRAVAEIRKALEALPEIRKELKVRSDEESRLGKEIDGLEVKLRDALRLDEEARRAITLAEEGQRRDAKRVTDLQGEVATLRKRTDEVRGKQDLIAESLRKLETRISELQNSESDRRQTQTAFMDKQSLIQVERDRQWKEWNARFEEIEKNTGQVDDQIQALEALQRSLKRSQEGFEDISQRFERRVNEITEMQRLMEERFRQEWAGFKNDDTKRWANLNLTQDEQQREYTRQVEKVAERIVHIEDLAQELEDALALVREESDRQLRSLVTLVNEWADNRMASSGKGR